jgi:hypothetical protein
VPSKNVAEVFFENKMSMKIETLDCSDQSIIFQSTNSDFGFFEKKAGLASVILQKLFLFTHLILYLLDKIFAICYFCDFFLLIHIYLVL